MVDPDVVRRRLRHIDRHVAALRVVGSCEEAAFLGDRDLQAQAERHLQVAIQSAIDIALHILAEDTAVTPESYGSAFTLLAEAGVICDQLADRLRLAAGLRNVLVHAYLDVDPRQVWPHVGGVDDLIKFAEAAESYLARSSGDS